MQYTPGYSAQHYAWLWEQSAIRILHPNQYPISILLALPLGEYMETVAGNGE